jgi:hypothetical protein
MPKRRWAVVSANANPRYAFYLPLVALAWMRVAGMINIFINAWMHPYMTSFACDSPRMWPKP